MHYFENAASSVVEYEIIKAFENPQETISISKNVIEIDDPQSPTNTRAAYAKV